MVPGLPCAPQHGAATFAQDSGREHAGVVFDVGEIPLGNLPRIAQPRPHDSGAAAHPNGLALPIVCAERASPQVDRALDIERDGDPGIAFRTISL